MRKLEVYEMLLQKLEAAEKIAKDSNKIKDGIALVVQLIDVKDAIIVKHQGSLYGSIYTDFAKVGDFASVASVHHFIGYVNKEHIKMIDKVPTIAAPQWVKDSVIKRLIAKDDDGFPAFDIVVAAWGAEKENEYFANLLVIDPET